MIKIKYWFQYLLEETETKLQIFALTHAPSLRIKLLLEVIHNILNGNLQTNGDDKQHLYKYKRQINQLFTSKQSIPSKRKLLSRNLSLVKIVIKILFKNKVLEYELSEGIGI